LGGLPFVLYVLERIVGSLPSEDVWYRAGINHGPWRGRVEGLLIYYPLLALLVVTLGIFISKSIKNKTWGLLGFGLLLSAIQIAVLAAQMYFLTWTID